jgi:hypothetical protein
LCALRSVVVDGAENHDLTQYATSACFPSSRSKQRVRNCNKVFPSPGAKMCIFCYENLIYTNLQCEQFYMTSHIRQENFLLKDSRSIIYHLCPRLIQWQDSDENIILFRNTVKRTATLV